MFFFAELSSAVCLLLTIGKKTDNQKIFRENTTVTIVYSEMQIKKFQFCAALAATSLQSVMGDSHPDPHGVAIEIGGAEVGHGHGHSHHANKVRTDCTLSIFIYLAVNFSFV